MTTKWYWFDLSEGMCCVVKCSWAYQILWQIASGRVEKKASGRPSFSWAGKLADNLGLCSEKRLQNSRYEAALWTLSSQQQGGKLGESLAGRWRGNCLTTLTQQESIEQKTLEQRTFDWNHAWCCGSKTRVQELAGILELERAEKSSDARMKHYSIKLSWYSIIRYPSPDAKYAQEQQSKN